MEEDRRVEKERGIGVYESWLWKRTGELKMKGVLGYMRVGCGRGQESFLKRKGVLGYMRVGCGRGQES